MKKLFILSLLFLAACQENNVEPVVNGDQLSPKIIATGTSSGVLFKEPEGMPRQEALLLGRAAFGKTADILAKTKGKNWEEASQIVENELAKIQTADKYWVKANVSGILLGNQFQNVENPSEKYYQKLEQLIQNLIEVKSPSLNVIVPALRRLESHVSQDHLSELAEKILANVAEADAKCTLTCGDKLPSAKKSQEVKGMLVSELKGIASRNNQ